MEIKTLNKKVISGFFTLTIRRAVLYGIMFANTNLVLARFLPPEVIGVFNIANAILAFFSYFSDIGLAAALIQKKEISHEDLKTTFSIQQVLALIIFGVVFFVAPYLASIYQLGEAGMWLIRALAFVFFLTSLKVLPSVLLERELRFGPLVVVEILETLVFVSVLDYLIFNNFGVSGYSVAVVARGVVGLVSIYVLAPWKVAVGFSKESAKELVRFGAPFQLNSLLALLKDRLVDLVVFGIIGKTGVGYTSWARSISYVPLEVMNIMGRITFPAFSRLQDDKEALSKTLEKSLFFTGLFMYPLSFGIMAIAPSLVEHVVRSDWRPALPMIYLFSVNAFWAALSSPLTNFLNAIGRIHTTLKLMVFWTILEWLLTPFLAINFGFMGVATSSALISFTSIIPIIIVKRIIVFKIIKNIYRQFLSAAFMGLVVHYLSRQFVFDIFTLLIAIIIGGLIYVAAIFLFAKKEILTNLRNLKNV